jgi:hypothetical protein
MKYLLSLIFIFVFSVISYGQTAQCEIRLSSYSTIADAFTDYSFNVIAPPGCAWTATSSADWITFGNIRQPSVSGVGNGTVYPHFLVNRSNPREGNITIGNQTHTVQQGSPCSYYYHEGIGNQFFSPEGGGRGFPIPRGTGSGNCSGTYTTNVNWITFGNYGYLVAPSEGVARSGVITFHYGNQKTLDLFIHQEAGCFYSIGASSVVHSAGGGIGAIGVTTGSVCQWRAETNQEWITVDNGNGTGNGLFTYSVAPNTGAARTGIINANGQNFTINQDAGKSRKRVRFF